MGDENDARKRGSNKLQLPNQNSKIIKTIVDVRGSVNSTASPSANSRKSVHIVDAHKDRNADDREPPPDPTEWDNDFVPARGKRVSVFTNASYAVAGTFKIKTHIGLLGCIIVVIGCVLGTGIFAAPQEILNLTGNASLALIIWFVYGMIAMIAALCYVELGCTFPVSGGDYAYLNECFGSLAAFLFQWASNLLSIPSIMAIMATVVAKNLVNPYVCNPQGMEARWITTFLAMIIILLLCYMNCKSAELTERVQGFLMIINIIAISLVIICGLVHLGIYGVYQNDNFIVELPPPPEKNMSTGLLVKFQLLQIVRSLFQASFSYFGYTRLGYITEEVSNPMRNLPLGVCISMPIVIALNIFVNFCYFESLSKKELNETQTIASDMFKSVLPPEHVSKALWIAPTLVAIAVVGGLSAQILTASRISFAGARNGHFPRIFGMIHYKHSTPTVSIMWIGFSSSLFVLVGEIGTLISIATYLETIFNCCCVYGLIYMRIKKKSLYRPIKLPLILPIFYALTATFLFIVPIVTLDRGSIGKTLPSVGGAFTVLVTGIPIYFLFVRQGHWRCECLYVIHDKLALCLQKIMLVIPESSVQETEDSLDLGMLQDRATKTTSVTSVLKTASRLGMD